MKKTKWQLFLWTFYYIFLFALLLYNSFRYLDSDFGWHIRVGQQISVEQAAPTIDYYNFTVNGAEWVDHEWLFNLIIFQLYKAVGYIGINIIFALLMVAVLVTIAWFSKKYFGLKNRPVTIMILQFLSVMAMSSHLGVRMQEIALLFLLLEIIILEMYNRQKNPRVLLWLTPLYIIWANLHGSYLIGLFIIFVWTAVKYIENKLANNLFFQKITPPVLRIKQIAIALPFFFLAAVSTLATPYGLKLYAYLSGLSDSFYTKHIAEWLPAYFLPINYYKLIYAALLVTFYALYMIELYWIKKNKTRSEIKPIDLFYLSVAFIFLILSFKSKRHFPLLCIVSFPVLAYQIKYFFELPASTKKYFNDNWLLKTFVLLGVILPTIYLFLISNINARPFENPLYCERYPCAALKFILANDQYTNLKTFNTYGWGGYLLWNWPDKKLFIDGRMPQYDLGEQTLLEEYYNFFDPELAEDKLKQYDIELVLLQIVQPLNLNWFEKYIMGVEQNEDKSNALLDLLDTAPDWHEVYNDNISIIYARQN